MRCVVNSVAVEQTVTDCDGPCQSLERIQFTKQTFPLTLYNIESPESFKLSF